MPIPAVLSENNWKNQGLTLRTAFEKIKKLQTGMSGALRSLAAAEALPAWDVHPKQQAYNATNQAIVATINAHTNNPALNTLLNNMRNALPQVKQGWQHAVDGLTLDQALGTPGFYAVFHAWGVSKQMDESVEFLKALHDHMPIGALYTTFMAPNAAKLINVDENLLTAVANAPGHNAPNALQKMHGDVQTMVTARWAEFRQSLKNAL